MHECLAVIDLASEQSESMKHACFNRPSGSLLFSALPRVESLFTLGAVMTSYLHTAMKSAIPNQIKSNQIY